MTTKTTNMKYSSRLLPLSLSSSQDQDPLKLALRRKEEEEYLRFVEQLAPKWMLSRESFPFDCTACGRCCKTEGSVYLSPSEIQTASRALEISTTYFIATYASHTLSNDDQTWVRLKDDGDSCIFLDQTNNQCQIYHARPSQCRTYPFWPSIVNSRDAWNAECRRADDDTQSNLPAWTARAGGCEGMRMMGPLNKHSKEQQQKLDQASSVPRDDGLRQLYSYFVESRRFPASLKEIPLSDGSC